MRAVDLARAAIALPVLLDPRLPVRFVEEHPTRGAVTASRILAVRMLAQAAAGATVVARQRSRRQRSSRPRSQLAAANVVIEVLHATSMVAVAAVSRSHRRTALTSAALAAAFAAAELRDFREVRRRPPRLLQGRGR